VKADRIPPLTGRTGSGTTSSSTSARRTACGSGARLDRVVVPKPYAAWVYPGACANKIGYWHVPGAASCTGRTVRNGRSASPR
jgi:hypothetical protein